MAKRKLEVIIAGDASSLKRALGSAGKDVDKFGRLAGRSGGVARKFGAGMLLMGKTAAVAGAAVGGGLFIGVRKSVQAFQEAEQIAAQTNAVLKSTGQIANVTAKDVANLADKISAKSGLDDEAVQSAENVLLTFTKVRNEVGAGNDVFNRASLAVANLSVALGKDMSSSAILVGKALNDPVKGVTALTRAGVQFTQQQRDQIARLVESGNAMKAQKMILRELAVQFGGSAFAAGNTTAGAFNKLKVAVGNLMESIGGALSPALAKGANALAKFVREIQTGTGAGGRFRATMVSAFNTVRNVVSAVADAMTTAFKRSRSAVQSAVGAIRGYLRKHEGDIRAVGKAIRAVFENVIRPVFKVFLGIVSRTVAALKPIVQGMVQVIRGAANVIMGIIRGDLGRVFRGLGQTVSGAVKQVVGVFKTMTAPIRAAAEAVVSAIKSMVDRALGPLDELIGKMGSLIDKAKDAASAVAGAAKSRNVRNIVLTPEGTDAAAIAAAQAERDSVAAGFDTTDATTRGNYLARIAGMKQRFTGKDKDKDRNQKIKQARKDLADFNREMARADTLADIDLKIRGLEQTKAYNDALRGIASTIKDKMSSAVDEYRSKWEATTGALRDKENAAALEAFDKATESAVANGPAALALKALQDEADSIARKAEDAANLQSLEDAKRSGDPRAIAAAEAAIAETERQRKITAAQQAAEDERKRIEETRAVERRAQEEQQAADRQAEMDRAVAAYQTSLDTQYISLTDFLAKGAKSYKNYVDYINSILPGTLDVNAADETAVNAGPGSVPAPTPYSPVKPTRPKPNRKPGKRKKGKASGGLLDYDVLYRTGEAGPEDVYVGSDGRLRVRTASESAQDSGGGGIHFNGPVTIGSARSAYALADRWAIRARRG